MDDRNEHQENEHRDSDKRKVSPETRARNRKLAIALGIIALGIYVIFIMTHIQ